MTHLQSQSELQRSPTQWGGCSGVGSMWDEFQTFQVAAGHRVPSTRLWTEYPEAGSRGTDRNPS